MIRAPAPAARSGGGHAVHSLAETARRLGVDRRTVEAMVERGELPALELDGRPVVPAQALESPVETPPGPTATPGAAPPPGRAPHDARVLTVSRALRQLGEAFARLAEALAEQEQTAR
jgi:excisionase family DNA binding protein